MELTIDATAMSSGVDIGYKVTDVGIFPNDWDINTLETFWLVKDCKHVTAKFFDDGYPLASINEVQSRYVNLNEAKRTNLSFYAQLIEGGRTPQTGDLIVSRNATVGEIAQVADWHPPFAMGQDVCLLRKKKKDFSSDFLQELFKSTVITKQLELLMVGSTFKRINIQQIRNLIIPFPSPEEQHEIANTLNAANCSIASLEATISKKKNVKLGVAQELLKPKAHWAQNVIGQLFEISAGKSKSAVVELGGRYVIMDMGSVSKEGKIICSKVTNQNSDLLSVGNLVMPKDDIGGGNIIGKVGYIDENNRYVLGDHVYRLTKKDLNVSERFFYYLINSSYVNSSLRQKVTGSAQLGLDKRRVLSQEVFFPDDLKEQENIATILNDLDVELKLLEEKLAKQKMIKQGLIQELLTGKTRLVNPNSQV